MKPGQINAGSGTTPTLIGAVGERGHGTRRSSSRSPTTRTRWTSSSTAPRDRLAHGPARAVCQVPVFDKGASATENSLNAAGRSLVVENNYGYDLVKFNDIIAGGVAVGGEPRRW